MAEKILVIDDEPDMLGLLKYGLEATGYEVITALDGETGLQRLKEHNPHLIILDIMLPHVDGWEICRLIRQVSTVPIIILTALDLRKHVVKGLNMGADDYVVKPFDFKELKARMEALLRRINMPQPDDGASLGFNQGELVIDLTNHQVFVRKQEVHLTPTEYNLLVFMARRPGRILSPELIFEAVWPYATEAHVNNVKWYIWRLRKKIEKDPQAPCYILTEPGLGYRFVG